MEASCRRPFLSVAADCKVSVRTHGSHTTLCVLGGGEKLRLGELQLNVHFRSSSLTACPLIYMQLLWALSGQRALVKRLPLLSKPSLRQTA